MWRSYDYRNANEEITLTTKNEEPKFLVFHEEKVKLKSVHYRFAQY